MPENYIDKLGLGTVQFGLDYGVSNNFGQTPEVEVSKILKSASDAGIRSIDTASLYGDSEKVLGRTMLPEYNFEIVTKSIPIKKSTISKNDTIQVRDGFYKSLNRLNRKKIYGFMLHHADDLKSTNAADLFKVLSELKQERLVTKIGVSIYDNEQIDFILKNFDIDLVQIPMNIFDQRLINSGGLKKLKSHNVEIHVRSAFLQGVVFMEPQNLPAKLDNIKPMLQKFHDWIKDINITPAQGALAFLMKNTDINKVICGVNTDQQLQQLIDNVSSLPSINGEVFNSFAIDDISLVNPTNW